MASDLKESLEQAIRERFGADDIDSVSIAEDADENGDKLLRVTIVFSKKLDVVKAKGLARRMRSTLEEAGNSAFPIIAFRSKADQKKYQAAAA